MNTTSRREKREARFYLLAKQGITSCTDFCLYKHEEKTLIQKYGFDVIRHGNNSKIELPSTISWSNAFKDDFPLVVNYYIHGLINDFPYFEMKNLSQILYTIAARANFEKFHYIDVID